MKAMRTSARAVAFLALLCVSAGAETKDASGADVQNTGYLTVVMDVERLRVARARALAGDQSLVPAVKALRAEADGWLKQVPFSVTANALVPPSGDKHDYLSFGPYWWPDPNRTNGLPYIRRDGEVNPQSMGAGSDRAALENMAAGAETLALAWHFTGERAYAVRACAFIAAWFLDPATRMNPHLKYGQGIPGQCEGRGIGIIETRRLIQVINAVTLLEGSEALTGEQRQGLQEWFRTYLQWLRSSEYGKAESGAENNHGTWYDAQVAQFALYTGQRELAKSILTAALKKRLAVQVSADGKQTFELARTRALTYSLVNLSGLLALAELGRQVGVDYWAFPSADESRLRAAVDYMARYADPEKPWPHQQITEVDRMCLYPFLKQARALTGDPQYLALGARLPEEAAKAQRGNLLWP
jgi:hypothetical protein